MRQAFALLIAMAAMAGIHLPAVAAVPSGFALTLAPAVVVVPPEQHTVEFLLINQGTQDQTIGVNTVAGWETPLEARFSLPAGSRHVTTVELAMPAKHDAGDHTILVDFSALPPDDGSTIKVVRTVEARIIVATGAHVINDLRIFGLSAPLIADSWDAPALNLIVDNSRSNVHRVVQVGLFGQVLLERGQRRTLSLAWTPHPFVGVGTITVGSESASTGFVPWKLLLLVLLLVLVLLLIRLARRRSGR
jgi:hypothetical protein